MEKLNTNSGIVHEMIAEIARSINKIPEKQKEHILEETIYFIDRKRQEVEEYQEFVCMFAKEGIDRVKILDMYDELALLHSTIEKDKLKKLLKPEKGATKEKTLAIKLSENNKITEINLDTDNGDLMFVISTCSDIKREKYVITEEMVFYKPAGDNYHLINSTTLKEIESFETMQIKDLVRKDLTYNGKMFSEAEPQYLNSDVTDATQSANKELIKVLTSKKSM